MAAAATDVASAAGSQSNDEQAIRALQARLATAVSARDLDAVMKQCVPGTELFVFDSDLPRQHSGWEAYRADWKLFLDSATAVKAEVEDLGVTVEGNAAFSHNLEHLVWTRKSDGSKGEQLMSVTDGYRKIGGKWLIVLEHWSIPVQDGKAVLMARP
ncbi:MAG: nuclear transport factor 2 family protein [Steroidobacteraceae bacterium]